ncbi:mucin-2-like [Lytechinus pictus]|uniref:mucin-2-like n=1 Tax=Lytechinus pictus TaxID=7653 RepID=UPI0030BA1F69
MDFHILFWTQLMLLASRGSGIVGQSPGDVRLVDGSSSLEGRIEVYYNGVWGTICDIGWDSTDANVICKQLGFQISMGTNIPRFGQGPFTQRVWLMNVQCESSDESLYDCVTNDQWGQASACPHSKDVGVRCSGLNVGIAPNYQGCYRFEDALLSTTAISFQLNTIETCLEHCSRDSMFAGLYGTACTCGDQIQQPAQSVDNTMCKMPCPGNSAQLCGDDETNSEFVSIYSVSIGDDYLASPWFPGDYVMSSSSEPANLVSRINVTASSGGILIQVLALDLAPGDTLTVEVGGMTFTPTEPGDTVLSGLSTTPTTMTATLMRAANSPGASGYLITSAEPPSTTTTPNPSTMAAMPTSQTTDTAPTNPSVVTTPSIAPTATTPAATNQGTDETTPVTSVTQPPGTTSPVVPVSTTSSTDAPTANISTCDHPVVEGGRIMESDLSPYQVGQGVVLDCDAGLNPVENTTLQCQSDGTWSPLPTCTSTGLEVWMIVVIAVVIALCLVILIIIFLILAVAFGKREKRYGVREDDDVRAITHLQTPIDNDYTSRPPLIPITESSAAGPSRQGTNISTASTLGIPPPPPAPAPPPPTQSNAMQQTEPDIQPPPSEPAPGPPSPTESYPPRDYPGAGRPSSVVSNGVSNGHVGNLGNEERQAVEQLINAVRAYDDSPGVGMYGSVPPRNLRSGSSLSVISNPGRVTDGRSSPRYSGNLRSVQFDPHRP